MQPIPCCYFCLLITIFAPWCTWGARLFLWRHLLVRLARQGGLSRRSAVAFRGEGACSQCFVYAGDKDHKVVLTFVVSSSGVQQCLCSWGGCVGKVKFVEKVLSKKSFVLAFFFSKPFSYLFPVCFTTASG